MNVTMKFFDVDYHEKCNCGLCDGKGRSFITAIYDPSGELIQTFHGPDEITSSLVAYQYCLDNGYHITY